MEKRSKPTKKLDLDSLKPLLSQDMLTTRNILIVLLALVFLAVIVNLRYFSETSIVPTTTTIKPTTTTTIYVTTTTLPPPPQKSTGKLVVALKDEEHSLPGGTVVKSMNFTVTNIAIYSDDSGWKEIFSGTKILNLLNYTDTLAIVAEADVEEGTYERIRLGLADGSIWITNEFFYIYTPKRYGMSVPPETRIEHIFTISPTATLTLILDFEIENSVTRIGVDYLMDPDISVTERSGVPTNSVRI